MARAGVTYIDIKKAAETIKSQNQEPTVDRVREYLGTGSKSTIAPLLKRWREGQATNSDARGLPSDLIDVVKSLYERVQHEADDKIAEAKEAFEKDTDKLKSELLEKRNVITQQSSRQEELEDQVHRLTEEKSTIAQSLEDTRIAFAKIEAQRDEAVARVNELKTAEKELKKECMDIRDHFEHYQQRTTDDRQQEREQFRTTNQQLQAQVQGLTGQLTKAEAQISELLKSSEHLRLTIDDLKEGGQTFRLELTKKEEQLINQSRALEASQTQNKISSDQNNELQDKAAALTEQQASAETQLAIVTQALEAANAELSAAKDKIVLMADENMIAIQEKALIQGQFKQLQSSLKD